MATDKPRIAIFSGPTATVQNSEPLITSNKARAQYGLPLRTYADGTPLRFDVLRPQRLAAAVTVYIEHFSAHPLERDAAAVRLRPIEHLPDEDFRTGIGGHEPGAGGLPRGGRTRRRRPRKVA